MKSSSSSMILPLCALFFLLLSSSVLAFSTRANAIGSRQSSQLQMVCSQASNGTAESLSDLTSKMLQSHREMKDELKELEQAQARTDKSIARAGEDGVYRIISEEQYHNFMKSHSDKLVILKFTTPLCLACKKLKQKFRNLHQDARFQKDQVVLADLLVSNNKSVRDPFTDFVTQDLQVTKIPVVQFFHKGETVDDFACDREGCSWPTLKRKMTDFVVEYNLEEEEAAMEDALEDAMEEGARNPQETTTGKKRWIQRLFHRGKN